jgi:hypothetical protein
MRVVRDLGYNIDLVGRTRFERRSRCVARSHIKADQLTAPSENDKAYLDVNEYVDEDDQPYWTIECSDPESIPLNVDPAPELLVLATALMLRRGTNIGRTIDLPVLPGADEEVYKSRNEGNTIAKSQIPPFKLAQRRGIMLLEKRQIDITCHGECP